MIPIGASQFFFFDGENVRKLVDGSGHDAFLKSRLSVVRAKFGGTITIRSTYLLNRLVNVIVQDRFNGNLAKWNRKSKVSKMDLQKMRLNLKNRNAN